MQIDGLQKLTLLDYPGHTACTIFTHGCNFRCPFCHNALLVVKPRESAVDEDELFAFLEKRRGILDGVCITGGEPTLQADLPAFIKRVKDLGYRVKLDSNGSRPDILRALIEAKMVDYVAMDIKNAPSRYAETVGVKDFDMTPVRESVALLLEGKVEYEFRTTVTADFHEKKDFDEIASWIGSAKRYYLQNFVDSGELIDSNVHGYGEKEMRELWQYVRERIPVTELRGI